MKTKSKKQTTKVSKVIPGISRTTQLTFIITAVTAYLLQALMSIQSLMSMPNILESFTRFLPVHLIDGLVLPLLLFAFGYFILKRNNSKVEHVFKATLVATIGVILSTSLNMLFMEVFSAQLVGGAAGGVSWLRLAPVILAVVGAAAVAWFVLRPVQDKQFTASRKVQKLFVGLIGVTFLVSVLVGVVGLVNGSNNGYMYSGEAAVAFMLSTLAILIPLGILYIMASKAQTKLTRIFNATLYTLILTFISSIVFVGMFSLKIYMHEPGSVGATLMPLLTIGILAAVVVMQKLQKAF